jgi:hypothetical protein
MKKWKLAFYIYTSQTSVPRTRMGRIPWMARTYLKVPLIFHIYLHCVQTDPAKNVWTRAYLIPERNRTVRRQEEGKNYVYLFVFCMNLGEINALLTISCCQMKHFGYVIVY